MFDSNINVVVQIHRSLQKTTSISYDKQQWNACENTKIVY